MSNLISVGDCTPIRETLLNLEYVLMSNIFNKKTLSFLAILTSMFAFSAFAGTGGAYFDAFYAEVAGWLTGAPGKIIMVFMFMAAGFYAVIQPDFLKAAGATVFGLVFANAETLITNLLTGVAFI
mgnify:FL=1